MKLLRAHAFAALAVAPLLSATALLFRRDKKPTRAHALHEVFDALANVYAQAANLKDAWRVDWERRADDTLPPKYDVDDAMARSAAHDMRFATALLQRNRWKSVVAPLFDDLTTDCWRAFVSEAQAVSNTLLATREQHLDLLAGDELDWIDNALEQFDDAARRAGRDGVLLHQRAAETVYTYVYAAIGLSDRLLERLRFEASRQRR